MNNPLFSIGEEVVLQSVSAPHLNGDCIVLEVISKNELIKKYLGYEAADFYGWGYILTIPIPVEDMAECWSETALRKKHKPSDNSYDQLMDKLKIGETV